MGAFKHNVDHHDCLPQLFVGAGWKACSLLTVESVFH